MKSVNFNQLLCRKVEHNGEDIVGIFDTLICEKGANSIFICVFSTQILSDSADSYDRYYYRMILRCFGKTREDMRSYRVDSGEFWKDVHDNKRKAIEEQQTRHKTSRPGSAERLVIEYEHTFNVSGSYEVDLYVKKMEESDTMESCEQLTVKELDLVSICPFQVIFSNN